MTMKQMLLTLLVAAAFAFLGGAAGSLLVLGESATAQTVSTSVNTRSFQLVDDRNVARASLFTFGTGAESGTTFLLHDRNGQTRLMLSVADDGTPNVHLFDGRADGQYLSTSFPSISLWGRGSRQLAARFSETGRPGFPYGLPNESRSYRIRAARPTALGPRTFVICRARSTSCGYG